MFSAKNEKNAVGATLLFNVAHYALRPWPWILIALASLVVFPEISDIQNAFPELSADKLGHDVAYPAMLTFLPSGLLGLVAASLIAAYMSTISTQLNLGASYLVNDFYQRFISPEASEQKLVWAGRLFTVVTMILGSYVGLKLKDAGEAFNLLLLLGAGTGLIYILRWFWWRINAYTEIVAMVTSLIIAYYLTFEHDSIGFLPLLAWQKTVLGALLTTGIWIVATYFTPQTDNKTLISFCKLIRPGGPGWKHITEQIGKEEMESSPDTSAWKVPLELLATVIGCITVFSALFAVGYWIYGKSAWAMTLTVASISGVVVLFRIWNSLRNDMLEDRE